MSIRRFAPVLALALLVIPLAGPRLAHADDVKTFEAQNVKWTLPSPWQFVDVPANAAEANFIAFAQMGGSRAMLAVYPSDLTLEEFKPELGAVLRQQLGDESTAAKHADAKLSGLDGFVVRSSGALGGQPMYGQAWAIKAEGRLTVLMVLSGQGAEHKRAADIDAARRGIRLIKGAGDKEEPSSEAPPSFDGAARSAGGSALGGEDDELTEEKWPEKGPKREGNVFTFEPYNLKLTMPEGSSLKVTGAAKDVNERGENGRLMPMLVFQRKEGEGAEERSIRLTLLAGARQGTSKPSDLVKNAGLQNSMGQAVGSPLPGTTKIEAEAETDAFRSSWIEMIGRGRKKEDAKEPNEGYEAIHVRYFVNANHLYLIEAVMSGPKRRVQDLFRADLEAVANGLETISEGSAVALPVAGAIQASFVQRGNHLDTEKEIKGPRFVFKKPKGTSRLRPEATGFGFAVEARTEDGAHAMYLDYRTVKMAELSQAGRTMEDLARDRGTAWETAAEGRFTLHPREKSDWIQKGSWGRAKGVSWEFSTTLDGSPVAEHGFVVKHKQVAYIIRVQFAGENAEKVMSKTYRAWKKAWKWSR